MDDSPLTAMRPQRSLWSNAWRRLRKNLMAMAALCYLFFLLMVAILAPVIAPHNPVKTDVAHAGTLRKAAWVEDPNPLRTGTWDYPLGTDAVGRDVFSRLVYGTRVSLVVGFIPMAVILLIGVPVGLIAGFAGGRVDNLLMRMTDVVYAFPALLLAIIMQISFGDTSIGKLLNGLVLLFISLSIVNWTGVARLVRGETLSLKEKEFVEAARTSGASRFRLITRHILPNALGPIIVAGAFIVPGAIISEAILSYLGVGVRPDVNLNAPFPTSWGQMILDGSKTYNSQLWMLLAPSIAVALTTLSFTFVGDGLRDALDPRQSD
ncbi:MAG TPA: ABC transporter permease [Thermomicrobiales bacterium]|jgi:oligopeptide transport system permease protein|nr:ABC transporter permease [Thermomicrobiales bacterium]